MVKSSQKVCALLFSVLILVIWFGQYRRWSSLESIDARRLSSKEAGPFRPENAATPEDLTAGQLHARNVLFGGIIGGLLVVLLIGSIIAVVCKSRRFQCGGSVLYECEKAPATASESQPLLSAGGKEAGELLTRKDVADDMRSLNAKEKERRSVGGTSILTEEQRKEAWKKMMKKEADIRVSHQANEQKWKGIRFWIMVSLLVVYIAACLILPRWRRHTASCHKGFFWELHMMFFSVFCVTKIAELLLYSCDPTIEGDLDWLAFSWKFLPSFLSYSDGYLDSTSIQIASSCSEEAPAAFWLSWTMLISYSVGVVLIQWGILFWFCCTDPSQKCLAKLLHMDALASCIKQAEGHEKTWYYTCMVRTFGEDIPQALQQCFFVLLVQRNYVMYVSILMSLFSGGKAIWDRIPKDVVNGAVYERLMRLIGSEEELIEDDQPKLKDFLVTHPFLKRTTHDLYPWVKEARAAYKAGETEKGNDIIRRMETELEHQGSKLEAAFHMFAQKNQEVMNEMEIKDMLLYLGFPASDRDVSDLLKIVDAQDRHLHLAEFEVYVGRTGGIFKLFEIRRQELLKKRMSSGDKMDLRKMDLLEVGLEEAEIASWQRILPSSDFETVANLKPCQKQALRHIRQLARRNHREALPEVKKRVQNMGFEEDKLWMTLAFVRELAPAIIHVDLDHIVDYLLRDTHYRNQFETNSSGGCMSHSLRKQWERNLFGAAYDKVEGTDRVKYGVLNVMNDKSGVAPCAQYGESYMVLKDVRLRITCAPEDSSIVAADRLAVLDYYAHVLNEFTDEELRETIEAANSDVETKGDSKKLQEYKEVQLHGEIALAKHVSAIVVHQKHRDGDMQSKIEKVCKKHGITMSWMDDEVRAAEETVLQKNGTNAWRSDQIDKSEPPN
mmetsp:Transcript_120811/g.188675  ORF Transcript_120811/g.188675 Transcript_120811/m.188675 type:complete len:895 (-) Transcript_120811:344-3028(-)